MTDSEDRSTSSLISVGRGAVFFGFGRVSSQILSFIILIILTNFLGASNYGIYAFGLTIISLIGSVANFGSDKANLRFIPANPGTQSEYLSLSYLIGLVGGISSGILIFIFAPLINQYTLQSSLLIFTLQLFVILLLTRIALQLTTTAFRALDLPELDSLLQQLLLPGAKIIVVVLTIYFLGTYESVLLGLVIIESCVALLGMYILIARTELKIRYPRSVPIKKYLSFSLPASIKDASSLLFTQIDIFMIGFFVTAANVGIYRVAIMLGTLIALPLASVNRIFPSISAKLYHNNQQAELDDVFNNVTRWVITLTAPILLVSATYRFEILQLLGPGFTEGATIFVVILIARFIESSTGVVSELLLMTDNQNIVSGNQVVFGSMNIFLNFVLIPDYGLFGAAIATITSMSLLSLARLGELLILEDVSPYTIDILRIIPAVIGMAAVLTVVQWITSGLITLVVGGVIASGMYLVLLYRFGITEDDKQLYESVKQSNPLFKSIVDKMEKSRF